MSICVEPTMPFRAFVVRGSPVTPHRLKADAAAVGQDEDEDERLDMVLPTVELQENSVEITVLIWLVVWMILEVEIMVEKIVAVLAGRVVVDTKIET